MFYELTNNLGGVRTPDFLLLLGKKDITRNISKRLISLTLTDNRGFETDQLDIVLDDSDGEIELPARNAVLTLFLGWKEKVLKEKGSFTVDTIEHRGDSADTVRITARSANLGGTLNASREMSWHDTTLGAIVESIAVNHELSPAIAPELAKIPISHIDKSLESDVVFLTRLADRYGATVAIKARKLLFLKAGKGVTASGEPIAPVTITRGDGDRHLFSITDRDNYSGVTAQWLDTKNPQQQQQNVKVEHQSPPTKQNEYLLGKAGNVFAIKKIFANKAQAERAAQAQWDRLQRDKVLFTINLAIGRETLYPETPVNVTGFKSIIDAQPWVITKLVHTLDSNGYTTALTLEVNNAEVEYSEVIKSE